MPAQRSHLSVAKKLPRRCCAHGGSATHLNRHQDASRITRQQVNFEPSESQVAREDQPAAGRERTRRKRLGFSANLYSLRGTGSHRDILIIERYWAR